MKSSYLAQSSLLFQARIRRGLSLRALAKLVESRGHKLAPCQLSNYERGAVPRGAKAQAIADALGKTVAELFPAERLFQAIPAPAPIVVPVAEVSTAEGPEQNLHMPATTIRLNRGLRKELEEAAKEVHVKPEEFASQCVETYLAERRAPRFFGAGR